VYTTTARNTEMTLSNNNKMTKQNITTDIKLYYVHHHIGLNIHITKTKNKTAVYNYIN